MYDYEVRDILPALIRYLKEERANHSCCDPMPIDKYIEALEALDQNRWNFE